MCISTFEPRKNHFVLFAALVPLFDKYPNLKLILLGGFGWENQDLMSYLSKTKYSDRIVILRNISESEKYLWIQNSIATIYPSLYEGFGIPILESLIVGKPTLYHYSAPMSFFNTYPNSYPVDMTSVWELEEACEKLISSSDSRLLKKTRFEVDNVSHKDNYFSFIETLS
jgi:glycosyltransferase involved in cell wall biosynthesis